MYVCMMCKQEIRWYPYLLSGKKLWKVKQQVISVLDVLLKSKHTDFAFDNNALSRLLTESAAMLVQLVQLVWK